MKAKIRSPEMSPLIVHCPLPEAHHELCFILWCSMFLQSVQCNLFLKVTVGPGMSWVLLVLLVAKTCAV